MPGSVENLWKGSFLTKYELYDGPSLSAQGDVWIASLLLAAVAFVLLFRKGVWQLVTDYCVMIFSPGVSCNYSKNRMKSALLFAGMLSFAAYLLSITFCTDETFLKIFSCALLFFVSKWVIMCGISYVSEEKELIGRLISLQTVLFIVAALVLFLLYAAVLFLFGGDMQTIKYVAYTVLSLFGVIYAVDIVRIFFTYKVPLFFAIMYLCTLEVLPILLIVKMILTD